jgi:hypothetical protein
MWFRNRETETQRYDERERKSERNKVRDTEREILSEREAK